MPSFAPGSASITSQHSSLPCRPSPAASVCASEGWTWTDSFSLVKMYLTSSCGRSRGGSNQISPMRLPAGVSNGAGRTSLPHGFSTVLVSSSMTVSTPHHTIRSSSALISTVAKPTALSEMP